MILGFTGTRLGMTLHQQKRVREYLDHWKPDLVLHGDCVGADAQFHEMALVRGIEVHIYPALGTENRAWCDGPRVTIYEPTPPLARNRLIVNECHRLLGIPQSKAAVLRSGTWSTIRYAYAVDKDTTVIFPDGSSEGVFQVPTQGRLL